jgi:hypothetical protein
MQQPIQQQEWINRCFGFSHNKIQNLITVNVANNNTDEMESFRTEIEDPIVQKR